jgi:hypothetical protein
MPFTQAAEEIEALRRVGISPSTVRRQTERAGSAWVEEIEAEIYREEEEVPLFPPGPDQLVVSVDGAMVPLLGGIWAEVKTLALGEVRGFDPEGEVQTGSWSYFSRLTDAETFTDQAIWETERRGLTTAGRVGAVTDGAEWIRKFLDYHCPFARRILDFSHAAGRVSALGSLQGGDLGEGIERWLEERLHQLKTEGPKALLLESRKWREERPEAEEFGEHLAYLEKRESLMEYPKFREEGWPIGSGSVESANKLVVEDRLKGAGMHWKRENVNPLLVLRNGLCSQRWAESWREIVQALQKRDQQRKRERRQARKGCFSENVDPEQGRSPLTALDPEVSVLNSSFQKTGKQSEVTSEDPAGSSPRLETSMETPISRPRKPASDHPWRRPFLFSTKSSFSSPSAKL